MDLENRITDSTHNPEVSLREEVSKEEVTIPREGNSKTGR
jgi:hypothetical protein